MGIFVFYYILHFVGDVFGDIKISLSCYCIQTFVVLEI